MADNQYPCPECGAVLRAARPIAAGKKVKCPKCENVFAPVTAEEAEPKAAQAAKRPKEDDEIASYGVVDDAAGEAAGKDERKKALGPLKDRGKRSARGPAQAIVTKPSNQLLGTSTITCLSCIITVVVVLWPLVFALERKSEDDGPPAQKKVELTPEQKKERAIVGAVLIAFAVLGFIYNGFIAIGAVKIQALEAYPFGIVSCFMMMLPFNWALAWPAFEWFHRMLVSIAGEGSGLQLWFLTVFVVSAYYVYVGVWNLITLRKPEVVAGFLEKKPTD